MKVLIILAAVLALSLADKEKRGLVGLGHGPLLSSPLSLGHSLPLDLSYGHGLAYDHGLSLGHGLSYGHGISLGAPLISAPVISKSLPISAPLISKSYLSAPLISPLKSYAVPAPVYSKSILPAPIITKAIAPSYAAPISLGHGLDLSGLSLGHGLDYGHGLLSPYGKW